MGLEALVGGAGARLTCPSCQANIVVPEAPEVSKPPGPDEKQEIYEVQPEDAASDDRAYVAVLCSLCHTRMYATEDEIGRKMTCPDCGTETTVIRPVEFSPQEEELKPVEFDASTEYAVHQGEWLPADEREAQRSQVPVVCPLCHTRMHAEESQVGSTIVCPDCQTELLIPAVPDLPPEPELQDAGEYGVGQPSEVFYPKYAMMADKPLDEPGTLPARTPNAPQLPTGWDGETAAGLSGETVKEEIERRPGKPPTFWQMFTFMGHSAAWTRWLTLGLGAAVVAFVPLFAVDLAGGSGEAVTSEFAVIAIQLVQIASLILAVFWAGMALPACLIILEETAAGTDAIEDWPAFGSFLCVENAVALSGLAYSAVIGHLIGQLPRALGAPDWLGIPLGVFFLFPIVLLSLLERDSLLNFFSPQIAGSLVSHWFTWLLFYVQSILLLAALLLVVVPASRVFGTPAALVAGPWFTAILMVYFRLMGRLAWHVSGELVPEEPIEPPDLSKLIERGEAEEIC